MYLPKGKTKDEEATGMKLYSVRYYGWNSTFSNLIPGQMLSVGKDAGEAIENAKCALESDTRDFSAEEIKTVMGHKIAVR